MEIDHKHRFDGKEDRNYHQKPFDDVTDPTSQIDETSARLADRTTDKPAGDPDAAGKGQFLTSPEVPDSDASGEEEEKPIDDTARLTQYPDGNAENGQ